MLTVLPLTLISNVSNKIKNSFVVFNNRDLVFTYFQFFFFNKLTFIVVAYSDFESNVSYS